MCMVCMTYKNSRSFINGKRTDDFSHQLYYLEKARIVKLTLCFIHSRDLYLMGERRFLSVYKDFAQHMKQKMESSGGADDLF